MCFEPPVVQQELGIEFSTVEALPEESIQALI